MYYILKDNNLYTMSDNKCSLEIFSLDIHMLENETVESYTKNPNKYILENNVLIQNPNYEAELA